MSGGESMSGAPHDCGGDAAAYVLGALEPAEAEAFRLHLENCVVCRDEVEALEGVARALPMSAPQVAVPSGLRRRVMRAVRDDPAAKPAPAPQRFANRRLAWGALAAAVVVAAIVVVGLSGSGASGRLIQAKVVGIAGSAQLRVHDGHGELIVRRLPRPPRGQVYEVWVKAPNAPPVPGSVLFSVNASGAADVSLPRSLHGISQVMVTSEPDGGTATPTHNPVIVASL